MRKVFAAKYVFFPTIFIASMLSFTFMINELIVVHESSRYIRTCRWVSNDHISKTPTNSYQNITGQPERSTSDLKGEETNRLITALINMLKQHSVITEKFWNLSYSETRDSLRYNTTDARYLFTDKKETVNRDTPSWKKFNLNINERYMYGWDEESIDDLLTDMATLRPKFVEQNTRGSELKFNFIFDTNFKANVKPMRYAREVETNPNHFVFDEFERHFAEIAAFHLDRLLGLCRVLPTTGRRMNLTEFRKLVPQQMRGSFFKSPAGNTCFHGDCQEHCSPKYAFCGNGDTMEFSLMIYVPNVDGQRAYQTTNNPYKGSYSRFFEADWNWDDNYCATTQLSEPYNQRPALLSLIDVHIFDFLTGNRDRHDITRFKKFGNASPPILYDNGRGFGRTDIDHLSILTPMWQCCQIKKSTLLKLIKLYSGPEKLSVLMDQSLQRDPVSPVLLPKHLATLDRRLVEVLKALAKCVIEGERSLNEVVFDDI